MTWTQAVRTNAEESRARSRAPRILLWRIGVGAAGLLVWVLVVEAGLFPRTLLPSPVDVVISFAREVLTIDYWQAVYLTLSGAAIGFIAASVIGIAIGVLTGGSRVADESTRFLIDFGRAFPAVALVAVLVLVLGRGIELKAVLVFVAVLFPVILQTQQGVRQVPVSVLETARAFRIPRALLVRRVMLPSATPSILTGLRLAASIGVLVAIATEVLSGSPGIGNRITVAQIATQSSLAFAYIATAGILGYALNAGLQRLQDALLRWRPAKDGE
ncbi:MAG: ABC transporter permease [Pseudoclavibacter sp.]